MGNLELTERVYSAMAATAPYDRPVPELGSRAVLLNRLSLALGLVGLFIAGYLSYVKLLHLLPACGVNGGCMAVTQHPSAYWFGIPVAYFGLVGYIGITGLAILREILGRELSKMLVGLGLIASTLGLLASAYLQYTAIVVIGELCKWCLASAITMFLTFVAHVLLFGQAADAERRVYRPRVKAIPFVFAGLLITGAAIALVPKETGLGPRIENVKPGDEARLVPAKANVLGDANAPVTIVEFADFCCPSCRQGAMKTRALVTKYPGKVRLVFRHFPLLGVPGHEMAYPLAVASEYAAKQGKFWSFHEAVMTTPEPPKTVDEVLAIVRNLGMNDVEIAPMLSDSKNEYFQRAYADFAEGIALNVQGTPSFFVTVKGGPAKKVQFSALEEELESGEFAAYVK